MKGRKLAAIHFAFLLTAFVVATWAQEPAPTSTQSSSTQQLPSTPASPTTGVTPSPAPQSSAPSAFSIRSATGAVHDDQIKELLLGKSLYLRGGYLDNTLNFDERGTLMGHSPTGSYTLSVIQVDKVHVTKHKVELHGQRYALHFLGALQYEDPSKAVDKVKITPKKKVVKISIDREQVEKPKKKREKDKTNSQSASPQTGVGTSPGSAASSSDKAPIARTDAAVNAAPLTDQSPDPTPMSTTTSPQQASRMLTEALNRVFALGIDDRMIAAMPDFWKLYYEAAAAKTNYTPKDPGIFRQSSVDQKAKLISTLEPSSNEYAQANAIAGIALYHAVIDADGKPQEIVAGRPIGFGLDESAVDTIRKATFQPAIKDGKPVPVWLDLVVSFRIYSKRTSEPSVQEATDGQHDSKLPGPYTVQHQ